MPSINIYPTSPNHVTSTALTSAHQGSMVVLVSRRISVWSEIHEIGISLGAIDSAHLYINKNKYDWCPFNICYHYYTSTSEVTAGLPHFLCLPAIDDQPIRRHPWRGAESILRLVGSEGLEEPEDLTGEQRRWWSRVVTQTMAQIDKLTAMMWRFIRQWIKINSPCW